MDKSSFFQLFNMLDDLCFILGEKENILAANKYAISTLGYSEDELIEMKISDFLLAFNKGEKDCNSLNIEGQDDSCLEMLCLRKDKVIPVITKREAGIWQNKKVIFLICKDVSKLVSANNRFSKAFNDNSSLMAISEIETGRYIEANKSFFEKTGYTREEVIGTKSSDLNLFVNIDDRNRVLSTFKKHGKVNNYEVKVRTKTGNILDGLFSIDTIDIENQKYLLTVMNDITETNEARRKIAESEANFRDLFNTLDDLLIILDKAGYVIYTNKATKMKLGYSEKELHSMHVLELHPQQYREEAQEIVGMMIMGKRDACPLPLQSKEGRLIPVETRIWSGIWNGEEVLFGISKDLSAQQAALDKFERLFDSNPSPIMVCKTDSLTITQVNNACKNIFKADESKFIGKRFIDFLSSDEMTAAEKILKMIKDTGKVDKLIIKIKTDENHFYGLVSADTITYMGERNTFIVLTDITELKESKEKVEYLSYHDTLTGVFNREFFEKCIKDIDNECNLPISIIMGDVNGLKLTNDVFGHYSGDKLLKSIANIFVNNCRAEDIAVRWGGDEFVLLLPKTSEKTVNEIQKRIKCACQKEKLDLGNDEIIHSISLGCATKENINESIIETMKIAERHMYNSKLLESRSMHNSIIESMKSTLYEKSHETQEHATRMTEISIMIGKALNLSEDELNQIKLFSMLHDIGKIAINNQILLKKGSLSDEEWIEMKKHSEIGYRIAQSTPELSHVASYILSHHEKWDGSGYPQGLSGEQIPLLSRIISVADAYDAMTQDRTYRKAMSKTEAIDEIKKCAGIQFEPRIAKIFVEIIQ
ncbi:PAS domain S-box protein [Clostridium sp. DL1XJH146]